MHVFKSPLSYGTRYLVPYERGAAERKTETEKKSTSSYYYFIFRGGKRKKENYKEEPWCAKKVWIMEQTQYDCEIYYTKSEIPPWKPNLRQAPLDLLLLYD